MNELNFKREIAQKRLMLYLKAEEAILSGQAYKIGDRELTRADLKDVADTINSLQKEINSLDSVIKGKTRVKVLRPVW